MAAVKAATSARPAVARRRWRPGCRPVRPRLPRSDTLECSTALTTRWPGPRLADCRARTAPRTARCTAWVPEVVNDSSSARQPSTAAIRSLAWSSSRLARRPSRCSRTGSAQPSSSAASSASRAAADIGSAEAASKYAIIPTLRPCVAAARAALPGRSAGGRGRPKPQALYCFARQPVGQVTDRPVSRDKAAGKAIGESHPHVPSVIGGELAGCALGAARRALARTGDRHGRLSVQRLHQAGPASPGDQARPGHRRHVAGLVDRRVGRRDRRLGRDPLGRYLPPQARRRAAAPGPLQPADRDAVHGRAVHHGRRAVLLHGPGRELHRQEPGPSGRRSCT